MPDRPVVFVDPRFGRKKGEAIGAQLQEALDLLAACNTEPAAHLLPFGDFAFFGNGPDGPVEIGLELKTVPDFINSMVSGRLEEQLRGLAREYPGRAWLVIEGVWRARRRDGLVEVQHGTRWQAASAGPRPIFWQDLHGFLTAANARPGVHVRQTNNRAETARLVAGMARWWQKPWESHTTFQQDYQPRPPGLALRQEDPETRYLRMAVAALPGVGWKRAEAIVEEIDCMAELVTFSVARLTEIAGIGTTLADRIYRMLHDPRPSTRV